MRLPSKDGCGQANKAGRELMIESTIVEESLRLQLK